MRTKRQEPANITDTLLKRLASVINGAVIGGMCVLAVMMLITVTNVVGRYAANAPIKGTYEIIGLLLICLTAAGLGYCQLEKGHIRVSIILDRIPRRGQAILDSLASLIGLGGISLICWFSYFRAYKYLFLTRGEVTEILGIHFFPFMFILFAGFVIFALVLLTNLIQSIGRVIKNE